MHRRAIGLVFIISDNLEIHLGTYKYAENVMFFEK